MANSVHRGTGLNNVSETWDENERKLQEGTATGRDDAATVSNDLEQAIREEAAEYDGTNKEDRLLDGERATVNDGPEAPDRE
ncbi:MAG TPA: hypothetical protein VHK69_14635 [Chitinophagaceae bacterium]|jgi:hypothetical protein|nr:hypothetical protein [Chitinophagaceae bacterium]